MKKVDLDREEQALLKSVENDEWVSVENKESEINRYTEIVKASFKKDKRVNIRMSNKDVEAIQTRALEEGIPYQTLMSSILHKFISGRLIEKKI